MGERLAAGAQVNMEGAGGRMKVRMDGGERFTVYEPWKLNKPLAKNIRKS